MPGADDVYYNYPLMESIAQQIQQCGTVAQSLLDAGVANKQTLLGSFTGDTAMVFEESFTKFQHTQQDTIEVTSRGGLAYSRGASEMGTNELQMMKQYP
ncbi:WXG100 family type VII secretion target [Mycolicibacterium palauense]|uniref:WXG100 family type VII secretion target n=1 Tax=Mycolicibacterium palauense TaxID=2034511 RepID=UPI000BFF1503|nr:hypothetical protein [Mycolicibacterium palauense]